MSLASRLNLYASGKKWYAYLPFLLLTAYFFFKVIGFKLGSDSTAGVLIPFQMLDFGIHELGHWLTIWTPSVICAAMGVGLEILFPSLIVYAAFKYRQYFTGAMCLSYVALAMNSGGQYMSDARSMSLPLVSMDGSDNPVHDWNFVFGKLHLLKYDHLIGNTVKGIGFTLAALGILFGCYLIVLMANFAGAPAEATMTDAEKDLLDESRPAYAAAYPDEPAQADSAKSSRTESSKPGSSKPGSSKQQPVNSLYPTALHGRLAESESQVAPKKL